MQILSKAEIRELKSKGRIADDEHKSVQKSAPVPVQKPAPVIKQDTTVLEISVKNAREISELSIAALKNADNNIIQMDRLIEILYNSNKSAELIINRDSRQLIKSITIKRD